LTLQRYLKWSSCFNFREDITLCSWT